MGPAPMMTTRANSKVASYYLVGTEAGQTGEQPLAA
jgi:hypothetical protein